MKTLKLLTFMLSVFTLSASAQLLHVGQSNNTANAIDNTKALPTGIYFIVNAEGKALTPWGPSVGQNVFLQPFTKSGVQKWQVTQHKTTKGITYILVVDGTDNLYLQPYPAKDHTPIVSPRSTGSIFKITAAGQPKLWYIKSVFYNGDALRSFVFSPNLPTEVRFEAPENTDRFLWKLVPVTN